MTKCGARSLWGRVHKSWKQKVEAVPVLAILGSPWLQRHFWGIKQSFFWRERSDPHRELLMLVDQNAEWSCCAGGSRWPRYGEEIRLLVHHRGGEGYVSNLGIHQVTTCHLQSPPEKGLGFPLIKQHRPAERWAKDEESLEWWQMKEVVISCSLGANYSREIYSMSF